MWVVNGAERERETIEWDTQLCVSRLQIFYGSHDAVEGKSDKSSVHGSARLLGSEFKTWNRKQAAQFCSDIVPGHISSQG